MYKDKKGTKENKNNNITGKNDNINIGIYSLRVLKEKINTNDKEIIIGTKSTA